MEHAQEGAEWLTVALLPPHGLPCHWRPGNSVTGMVCDGPVRGTGHDALI